jgi:hypothetical protein
MSDRTKIQHKKADTSTVTNSSLVSPTSPTLASPTCGFTSPQADTVLLKTQETQSSTEQPQQKETLKLQPLSHDISRISLRPQAKLSVSQPGDPYEQEADQVASQVMRMQAPDQFTVLSSPDSLQRKCTACEEEIQRKASDSSLQSNSDIESQLSAKDGGSPLPDNVRAFMEPRFGSDFSQVRVHTDGEAVQMSRELGAQAFTYGSDVYFGAGKSPGNNELTAHELTHVVQQGGSRQQRQQQEYSKSKQKQSVSTHISDINNLSPKQIQRDGTAPGQTPAAPSKYNPPPEVASGMLPDDAQMVSIDTKPLYNAINGANWPSYTREDPSWVGWTQIANLTSQSFWTGNLRNATTGAGIRQDLAVEDISFPGGYLHSSLQIQATIRNVTFESADGVGVTQGGTGTASAGSSSAVTTTNTAGVSGQVSQGGSGQPGQQAGASASTATASTSTGQAGWSGSSTTATAATEGVRFKFDIDWNVTIRQSFNTGTGTTILSLGLGNLAAYIQEVPLQTVPATTTNAVVRFPKVRCTPA